MRLADLDDDVRYELELVVAEVLHHRLVLPEVLPEVARQVVGAVLSALAAVESGAGAEG